MPLVIAESGDTSLVCDRAGLAIRSGTAVLMDIKLKLLFAKNAAEF